MYDNRYLARRVMEKIAADGSGSTVKAKVKELFEALKQYDANNNNVFSRGATAIGGATGGSLLYHLVQKLRGKDTSLMGYIGSGLGGAVAADLTRAGLKTHSEYKKHRKNLDESAALISGNSSAVPGGPSDAMMQSPEEREADKARGIAMEDAEVSRMPYMGSAKHFFDNTLAGSVAEQIKKLIAAKKAQKAN